MSRSARNNTAVIRAINNTIVDLPVASNITVLWNFGFLISLTLIFQIVTGIILSMHYTPNIELALSSVNEHIMRNVNGGWAIRNYHANGANIIFICIYIHIGRSLYLGSYYNSGAWYVGVILFVVAMATALFGYVLVWGQISYWAATVITSLVTAVPYCGSSLAELIWGDYCVGNATLNRLFSAHLVMPFFMVGLTVFHVIFIHENGSSNPLGLNSLSSNVPLHQYFTVKDFFFGVVYFISLSLLVYLAPYLISDPANYQVANPIVTPTHIKPEFYLLWAYAILRSVPSNVGGVVAILAAIAVLFLVPSINNNSPGVVFSLEGQLMLWGLAVNFVLLSYLGACPVEMPYDTLANISTFFYFYLLISGPLVKAWEEKMLHQSLA